MSNTLWSSQALNVNTDTCIDVTAEVVDVLFDVLLGILGDAWSFNLHLTPEQAIQLAEYLTEGATKCFAAREG